MRSAVSTLLIAAGCIAPRNEPVGLEHLDAALQPDVALRADGPAQVDAVFLADVAFQMPSGRMDAGAASSPDLALTFPMDVAVDRPPDTTSPPPIIPDPPPPESCSDGKLRCLGTRDLCDERLWGFENGDEGWDTLRGLPSSLRARSGSWSFEMRLDDYNAEIRYAFCGNLGSVDVRGMTLTAWAYWEVSSGTPSPTSCQVGGSGGGSFGPSPPTYLTPGRWTPIRMAIDPVDLNGAMEIGTIYVECDYEDGAWLGDIYIDDVTLD